jgi:threonine dehydrogenase-like Zn-dependent dehydrogenase
MLALEYHPSAGRHTAARASHRIGLGALRLTHTRPPRRPNEDWLLVRPRLSGICGSDQALVDGSASPYLGALASAPFVPGHEVVGELVDRAGTRRVVVEPALGCTARGIEPLCEECSSGHPGLCRNVIDGVVGAGLQIGFCRDTGGGWSEGLVAHRRQLHAVPDSMDDEDAVLVEPLACSLHAVRLAAVAPGERVAVIGAGTIGLLVLAALRARTSDATVLAVGKYPGQQSAALALGADHVCSPDRLHLDGARVTGARRIVGRLAGELLLGGFDRVLDCVGSSASLQAAVTVTRPGGTVVLVGMPGVVSLDASLAWQRELQLHGAYGYGREFAAAIELATCLKPGRLIDHGFHLRDFRKALPHASRAARTGRTKTVFDLRRAA